MFSKGIGGRKRDLPAVSRVRKSHLILPCRAYAECRPAGTRVKGLPDVLPNVTTRSIRIGTGKRGASASFRGITIKAAGGIRRQYTIVVKSGAPGPVCHSVPKTVPLSWRILATGGVLCCAVRLENAKQRRKTWPWFAENRERMQASNLTVMV